MSARSLPIVALALTNHIYFHRHEPRHATRPIVALILLQPFVLCLLVGHRTYLSILYCFTLFFVALGSSIVLYRLSPWHPLAAFPGPTFGKSTKLWGAWVAWRGKQHLYLRAMHDRYGLYVRTGPNELSIADASVTDRVIGFKGLPKGRFYETGRNAPHLFNLTGEAHTAKRQMWNRAMMSVEAFQNFESFIGRRATNLVGVLGRLYEREGGEVDLVKWFELFALDTITDIAFGEGFDVLRQGMDPEGVLARIRASKFRRNWLGHIPWAMRLLSSDIEPFTESLLTQRTAKETIWAKDFLHYLTEIEAVDGESVIMAGADTIAATLSSFFWFLLCNPDCYSRLQKEILDVYKTEVVYNTSRHPQLHYLAACLNETLRLHPPVLTNGTRTGGKVVGGRFIPPDTNICIPPYAMHRRPECFFPQTEEFNPDRWLPAEAHRFTHNLAGFIPFSIGPVMKVFRFEKMPGVNYESWPAGIRDELLATRDPLWVKITLLRR